MVTCYISNHTIIRWLVQDILSVECELDKGKDTFTVYLRSGEKVCIRFFLFCQFLYYVALRTLLFVITFPFRRCHNISEATQWIETITWIMPAITEGAEQTDF